MVSRAVFKTIGPKTARTQAANTHIQASHRSERGSLMTTQIFLLEHLDTPTGCMRVVTDETGAVCGRSIGTTMKRA